MLAEGWHSILGTPRQGISRSKVPNILTLTSTYLSELSYKQTHDVYKSHKAGICSELVAIYHLLWQQQITIINSSLRTILLNIINININMAQFNFFFFLSSKEFVNAIVVGPIISFWYLNCTVLDHYQSTGDCKRKLPKGKHSVMLSAVSQSKLRVLLHVSKEAFSCCPIQASKG